MSDETQTKTPDAAKPAATPAQQPEAKSENDAVGVAMRALQDENRKASEQLQAALAKLAERDTEVTTLRAQVDGYGKRERESAIVGRLRNALPHSTEFEIRSALAGLHEAGKIDRYADKPDEVAKTALELIKVEAPSLTRPPTSGGGSPGVRVEPGARQHKSLI